MQCLSSPNYLLTHAVSFYVYHDTSITGSLPSRIKASFTECSCIFMMHLLETSAAKETQFPLLCPFTSFYFQDTWSFSSSVCTAAHMYVLPQFLFCRSDCIFQGIKHLFYHRVQPVIPHIHPLWCTKTNIRFHIWPRTLTELWYSLTQWHFTALIHVSVGDLGVTAGVVWPLQWEANGSVWPLVGFFHVCVSVILGWC